LITIRSFGLLRYHCIFFFLFCWVGVHFSFYWCFVVFSLQSAVSDAAVVAAAAAAAAGLFRFS
jgi:hypothetical protein